jgi:hypothetical protein
MKAETDEQRPDPKGELEKAEEGYPAARQIETFGGGVEVRWAEDGGLSLNGPLTYFVEFLKISGLWKRFVDRCPLSYTSPNAPSKDEILATILVSVLSGHRRYAHITGLRGDGVLAEILGIEQFRSEDSVRRAFEKVEEESLTLWLDQCMQETYEALLGQEWILDVDATVKTLYGKQEEAKVGYNPMKPGRPSHVYHAMLFTAAKLILNVDVQAGNQTASAYGLPTLFGWLDVRDRKYWPSLVRGDCGHGNEEMMAECERRELSYVFKLKRSKGVIDLAKKLNRTEASWRDAGQGWEGVLEQLQLQGWSRARTVLVTRQRIAKPDKAATAEGGQLSLPGIAIEQGGGQWYEYSVLASNWRERDVRAIAQIYRDRGDAENQFDELKNQWGWRGFSTADLKRSQLMARIVALIYNWWSIYTRMATGPTHGEAITTRPLLQQGVARRTTHANRIQLTIASVHAKARKIAHLLTGISTWLRSLASSAEQLTGSDLWNTMLCRIFQDFGRFKFGGGRSAALLASSNCRI